MGPIQGLCHRQHQRHGLCARTLSRSLSPASSRAARVLEQRPDHRAESRGALLHPPRSLQRRPPPHLCPWPHWLAANQTPPPAASPAARPGDRRHGARAPWTPWRRRRDAEMPLRAHRPKRERKAHVCRPRAGCGHHERTPQGHAAAIRKGGCEGESVEAGRERAAEFVHREDSTNWEDSSAQAHAPPLQRSKRAVEFVHREDSSARAQVPPLQRSKRAAEFVHREDSSARRAQAPPLQRSRHGLRQRPMAQRCEQPTAHCLRRMPDRSSQTSTRLWRAGRRWRPSTSQHRRGRTGQRQAPLGPAKNTLSPPPAVGETPWVAVSWYNPGHQLDPTALSPGQHCVLECTFF